MTLDKVLQKAAKRIPRREAELLAAHALGWNRPWILAHGDHELTATQQEALLLTIEARALGSPMAYLTGTREFFSREFAVDQRVLIPRPETETLIEAVLQRLPEQEQLVLDLGTGSGIIAATLALERPAWSVTAVDASDAALDCAGDNAERHGVENLVFLLSDWYGALSGWTFDLIVANPPYIGGSDPHLAQGDLRFEPRTALTDGSLDGLASIRTIITGAPAHLNSGGWLMFEHGYNQADACRELLGTGGFTDLFSQPDLAGIPRVAGGRRV